MGRRLEIKPMTRFGRLTYIREGKRKILPSGQKPRMARCKCDCGKIKNILLLHLVRGRIQSCGCLAGEQHGESNTNLYTTWRGMKARVTPNWCYHQDYYDRGIDMHKSWNIFSTFKKWAMQNGYQHGLIIDRKDNDKGYYPDNCRFVTDEISVGNRRNTIKVVYKGTEYVVSQLCRKMGFPVSRFNTICNRLKRGWNGDDAIDTPIRIGNYRKSMDHSKSMKITIK